MEEEEEEVLGRMVIKVNWPSRENGGGLGTERLGVERVYYETHKLHPSKYCPP